MEQKLPTKSPDFSPSDLVLQSRFKRMLPNQNFLKNWNKIAVI